VNRITRSIASICAPLLLMAGCSADHANAPGAMALLAPSPMDMKAEAPSPPPSTSGWVAGLSNPYLGFEAGRVFNYRSETPEGLETTVVEVTSDTRLIQGVVTTVVHDRVSLDGSLIEDTYDWYAQDTGGTVWYFGEDSKQIDHGVVVGTEGSWEAGVNGAQAGIAMLADPKVGVRYSQEYSAGVAEDMARIQSLSRPAQVAYGSFDCMVTLEWTPLDKKVREYKYYARGVGLVLTTEDQGTLRDELVSVTP
jgi:hypothetical protein